MQGQRNRPRPNRANPRPVVRRLRARAPARPRKKNSAPPPYAGALLLAGTLAALCFGAWLWQQEKAKKTSAELRLQHLLEEAPAAAVFQEKSQTSEKKPSPKKSGEAFQSEDNYDPDAAVRARHKKNTP